MPEPKRYKILSSWIPSKLEDLVNESIKEGYMPIGGVFEMLCHTDSTGSENAKSPIATSTHTYKMFYQPVFKDHQ